MIRGRIAHQITLPLAAALPLCILTSVPALAAHVSGTQTAGYERLLFELDSKEMPTAALADGVLVLRFETAPGITAEQLQKAAGSYVSAVRMDGDGRTFRFALNENVRLHSSSSANRFALDLVPQAYAGTPPDLPPPPPPPSKTVDIASLPALKVRAGAYAHFTRLVFDWPTRVNYTVYPGAGRVTVRFDAEAKPDFTQLEQVSPPWVKQAGWHIERGGTVIDFDTDSNSGYHDFRDGTHVVVDVLAPKTDAQAYNPPGIDKADAKSAIKGADETIASAVLDTAAKVNSKPGVDSAKATSAPQPVEVKVAGSSATLTLANASTVAAFVRGMNAFIVRDDGPPLDVKAIRHSLGSFAKDVSFTAAGHGASVLRIALATPEQMAVRQDNGNVMIALAPQLKDEQATPITLGRDPQSDDGAGLEADLTGATHVVTVADPDAGDTLLVIPGAAGHALAAPRRFVDFEALPSAAGLVLAPYADNLVVEANNGSVHIDRPGGLTMTAAGLPSVSSPAGLVAPGDGPSFIDFRDWAHPFRGTLLDDERRLRAQAALQPTNSANPARRTEARFLIANGLDAEALGMVRLMQAADPALMDDPELETIKGAADVMMGRNRDAITVFSASQFLNDPHAALWRGLAYAALDQWQQARDSLQKAMVIVSHYPEDLQARVRIAYADAALATGAPSVAEGALSSLPAKLPKPLFLAAELTRAQLFARAGRYYAAAPLFKALKDSSDPSIAAHAIYDDTVAGLAAGSLTPAEAIDRLESLRYRWRGDALELATLRKLGSLYFAQQKWRQGLGVLRTAVNAFPKDESTRQAEDDMRAAFADLFLHGKADSMPPIQALALFYDFIDLTPIGADGDEMIRRMADRLAKVDLLGPAEQLLQYQVDKRLDGVAQAQVAARLAMLYLMDHKAKEALAAIRATRVAGMPDDIAHDRLLLEARALAALKQYDQAADLIAVDTAPDTLRLRADIYWEAGNWPKAGQASEAMLGTAWKAPAPLSDEQRSYALRAAIAYSLAGDDPSLARIRSEFGPKMEGTSDASAFNVVTQSIDTQGLAFRDVAAKIASVDTLQSFMADFKKQFDTLPPVSAATN